QAVTPADRPAVAVWHDAVELPLRDLEDQRQEMAVAFPERQFQHVLHIHPVERSLGVLPQRLAAPAVDAEDETEPVLPLLAEAGPAHGAAQHQRLTLQAGLLANLAAQTSHHVLAGVELAAQAIVLAQVRVIRPAI